MKDQQGEPAKAMTLPELSLLESELEREQYNERYGRTLRGTVYVLIVIAAIAVIFGYLVFPVYRIYGSSMAPAMEEGDMIVALKDSSFEQGDIVMLSYNNRLLVKRVIACPGQTVDMDAEGHILVDGELLEEPYASGDLGQECTTTFPYQVPESRYFVLGDNRSVIQDSRNRLVSGIADEQIIGRVIFRVWPLGKAGFLNK